MAVYAANHLDTIKALVALTESGSTPKLMSRMTSSLPMFGLSRHEGSLNAMALYRGVKSGDQFDLTYGDQMEQVGATNACKIVTVP